MSRVMCVCSENSLEQLLLQLQHLLFLLYTGMTIGILSYYNNGISIIFRVFSNKLPSSHSNYYRKLVLFINLGLANKISTITVKRKNTDMPDMSMYV